MIRIGIICPSEIAFRRFMPALQKCKELEYVGIAFASAEEWFGEETDKIDRVTMEQVICSEAEKAHKFQESYGGKIFEGYQNMLRSKEIDAVYIPLPPALHYKWAKMALNCGVHVFVEKPSTTSLEATKELIELAEANKLALHENYMFAFHSQLDTVQKIVESGEIGEVRLYRIDFGFPQRSKGDFRYTKKLGGGALLDCGGYTLKYGNMLLGGDAKVICANVMYADEFDVEIFGTGTMKNEENGIVQFAFGMDNDYRCNIDIWGSKGTLTSNRILTAPAGYIPSYKISKNGEVTEKEMEMDDAFFKSIEWFVKCIQNGKIRKENYVKLKKQESLVDEFAKLARIE